MENAENSSVRSRLLQRLVEILEAGRTHAVELLLIEYPELHDHADMLVECIYAEFCDREKRGQEPQLAEYLLRFPEHADLLISRFDVHRTVLSQEPPEKVVPGPVLHAPPQPLGSHNPPRTPFRSPESVDLETGSTLGVYEILGKLGQGGMGAVYKARHQHLDKIVALKVLPQQLTQNTEALARFKREMKAAGRVEHPNIVIAMDAGEVEGSPYLAMEFIEGSDLNKLIKQAGPMAVRPACKAVYQAAQAIAAAHQVGLVHRDLKPANLLLAKTGQIKVLDLGLARLDSDRQADEESDDTQLTSAGQFLGTPDFMPPEQWSNPHTADARADLYSLGCTLFFLLVGRAPYTTEKSTSLSAKMKGHLNDPIPDLRLACPIEVPDGVVRIYEQLLAKDPENRLQTATILAEALRPFAGDTVSAEEIANNVTLDSKPVFSPRICRSFRWRLAVPAFSLLVVLLIVWRGYYASPPLWFPAQLHELGFKASNDSRRCRIHDQLFETQFVRDIAGTEVFFHLVPEFEIRKKDRIIQTFYMMDTPVTNAMFNMFATENPGFELVDRDETQRTWKSGNNDPVVNIHPMEAQEFARWLVPDWGSLPTTYEWDLAAGYYDFVDLLKDKVHSQLSADLTMVGENRYTLSRFIVGTGPGVGEFQAVTNRTPVPNRSPYGCCYPSHTATGLFEFGEMTATVGDIESGLEDLRGWTSDLRKVNLEEIPRAQSQLRMLIKHDKDFCWIIPQGKDREGLCPTAEELDELCGIVYLNTSDGKVGFNSNIGFRVVVLTKPIDDSKR